MPNWMMNKLTLSGDPGQIQQFVLDTKGDSEELDFEKLLPCPLELMAVTSPVDIVTAEQRQKFIADHPDRQKEGMGYPITPEMSADYIKRFGTNDWYMWCLKNWGCKWPASETRPYLDGCYMFDTAWSPPQELFMNISDRYPLVVFRLEFSDPSMGILGCTEIQNGEVLVATELSPNSVQGKNILEEFGVEPDEEVE